MRKIKFRAWDKKLKFMLTIFDNTTSEDWFMPNVNKNFEVMQYIDKNDINNKEIYESDKVNITYGKCYNEKCGLTRKGIVVYDVKTASFKISVEDSAVLVGFYDINKIEVMGNIFEN